MSSVMKLSDAPARATKTAKPDLLTVEDAKALDIKRMNELFVEHINPGQLHFMKLLGFHKIKIERAEGMYYFDQNGRKILDFFGGFGSLAFGHNHPRILEARRKFADEKRQEIAIAFLSQYAAALAANLAACSPGDLDMVFLGSSGSEAMEAALKVAERAAGPNRPKIVYAENSFHGKTKGVLSITDGALYRGQFKLTDNTVRVPFGDIDAIEAAFKSDPAIGTIVLETVQGGGGIIEAQADFWPKLRALCDKYGVLWVADEVQCGFGRTGKFYAFEHYGVVPDVTALAKSLGGGKAAVGAMIASRDVYMKAYGTSKTAMIHAMATFGGIGEASITSIEALNVLYDEGLIDNAAETGDYLLEKLRGLQAKHPTLLKDVRGRGMMVGLEFHDFSQTLPLVLRPVVAALDDKLKGSLPGFIGSHLMRDHGVLVAFTEYNRNVIRLEPPLICERAHVDEFITALDEVMSRGVVKIVTDFVKAQVS
ncbi:aspartate aminotransferase family protein [Devosia sp.]|uniref:aspartate aminotransferase family protein n=1 Tax=Devosia sp. TaxID=1871048 RepID=UPI001AC02206|nr:aspartate aminotransferase family protein [Devosia sp.]MBN9334787.1 aspartate aminotransferase family protein [Devosia sp.]